MNKILLTICLCCMLSMAFCQSEFLKTGSIGTPDKPQVQNQKLYGPVNYRALDDMIDEEFIVMPKEKVFQIYGYKNIQKQKVSGNLSYKEGVGLILKLVNYNSYKAIFKIL